jgi:hypothetical protein
MPVSPASPESLPAPLLPPSRTSLAVPARRPAHAAVGHVQATAAESAIRAAGPFHTANAPQIRAGHLYWPTICHQCCKLVDGSSIYCGCWRPDPGAGHPAARLQCSLRQPGFPTGAGISERCPAPRPGRQAEPVSPLQPAAWTRPTYNQSLTDTTLCGHTDTPLSIPVENSPLFRSKIPQPPSGGGLQFRLVNGRYDPAGEAEAGNAGVQPAKE